MDKDYQDWLDALKRQSAEMTKNSRIWLEALNKKRAPAEAEADRLVAQGEYDASEKAILDVDNSIYGNCAIIKVYRRRLEAMVAAGEHLTRPAEADAVFRRALHWEYRCYPEAHTAIEAQNYSDSQDRAHAELVAILGRDPGPAPA